MKQHTIKKGSTVKLVNDINTMASGGPLLKKDTVGEVLVKHRDGRLMVDFGENGGQHYIDIEDVILDDHCHYCGSGIVNEDGECQECGLIA